MRSLQSTPGLAWFGSTVARDVIDRADLAKQPHALEAGGWWAVVADFEGRARAWRFGEVDHTAGLVPAGRTWHGPPVDAWRGSLDRDGYIAAVEATRRAIRDGVVYQANICRVLSAAVAGDDPDTGMPDAPALAQVLARGNPAPYAGGLQVPADDADPGAWVVSASPELFVEVLDGRIASGPIKGTAPVPGGLGAKDRAENIMITDLVRNDLQRICEPGTVQVDELLAVEEHPGLAHLVSRVSGRLRPRSIARQWQEILAAVHPPGSVSGAPKSSALRLISELEPVARGPYCGGIGWIDADAGTARLAVGIRTFWWEPDDLARGRTRGASAGGTGRDGTGRRGTGRRGTLRFGTGAGITWQSDAAAEWEETELKARRLIALASQL